MTPATKIIGTKQQEVIWDELCNGNSNIIVEALAGTGKTTTIVEGLKRLKPVLAAMNGLFPQSDQGFAIVSTAAFAGRLMPVFSNLRLP